MWLDLDSPSNAFFLAFSKEAGKRRAMPDRNSLTIYLKPEQHTPDVAAYPLSLDEESLDADWFGTVKWLDENKRERSPHVFGTVSEGD
jgi:hypothetical protein